MSERFTLTDLVAEVRKVAAAEPGFVYDAQGTDADRRQRQRFGCGYGGQYVGDGDGRPCIIGQALINLGVPRGRLIDLEGGIRSVCRGHLLDTYLTRANHPARRNLDPVDWLGVVQDGQDGGESWGEAVRRANEAYPNV